jgi:hypothetical protein
MSESATDPFDQFFTPEQLAYYRKLHLRYPLWCGEWPPDLQRRPESMSWSEYVVLRDVMGVLQPEFLLYQFEEDASEDVAPRPWFLREVDDDSLPVEEGPVYKNVQIRRPPHVPLLAAASYYVSLPWQRRPARMFPPSRVKMSNAVWAANVSEILERGSAEPSGYGLWDRYLNVVLARTRQKREKATEELERYWRKIGREAGIVPDLGGGSRCTLPNEFLWQLQCEAEELVAEVAQREPDSSTVEVLRAFSDAEEALSKTDSELFGVLTRRQAKGGLSPSEAEVLERLEAKIGQALKLDSHARRLAFPMLTKAEIDLILEEVGPKPKKRTTAKVATTLLADRLPVSRKTVLHRISPYR